MTNRIARSGRWLAIVALFIGAFALAGCHGAYHRAASHHYKLQYKHHDKYDHGHKGGPRHRWHRKHGHKRHW